MPSDIERVRDGLIAKVIAGYRPTRTSESAEDHGFDWIALDEEEFEQIIAATQADVAKGATKLRQNFLPQTMSRESMAVLKALRVRCDDERVIEAVEALRRNGVDVRLEDLNDLRT